MKEFLKSRDKESNTKIPWMMLALGFIFVLNPNISIIDPLPDCFGYMIICASLGKLSLLGESMYEAKKAFERMILIDGAKVLMFIWVFAIDSSGERAASLLLWSFVFAVLEAIFLIPTYIKLFKGLSDLGDYHNNNSIHAAPRHSRKSYTEKIRNFTVFFVIFKAVMALLPELADLGNYSYDETNIFSGLYRYIGIMRLLACIPVLIMGIVWFCNIIRYFSRIKRDTEFNLELSEKYTNQVLPRSGMFIIRYIKTACWFLIAAAVFTLDFSLEGKNIIPDVLVIIPLVLSYIYFCKASKGKSGAVYTWIAVYGISAIAADVLNNIYQGKFTYNAMDKNFDAFLLYMSFVLASSVKGIIFIILTSSVMKKIKTITVEHTGFVLGREIVSEGERRRSAEIHREINQEFNRALNVLFLCIIADVLCSLYGVFYAFMRMDVGYFNIISIAMGIIYIGMTVRAADTLKEAVKTKYMLQ